MSPKRFILPVILLALTKTVIGMNRINQAPEGEDLEWQIDKTFNVYLDEYPANDPRSKGNCAKWRYQLEESYQEVSAVIDNALGALAKLHDTIENHPDPQDQEKTNGLLRLLQPFWLM